MKSMKAKAKAKKANGKFGRVKYSPKEVNPIDPDLSQLRQPIDTSVSTLYRVTKVLEHGSDEVRSILAYECDLVYECRICRSLFRSLINFISHKRIYCTEKFDVTFARNFSNNYDTSFASDSNIQEPEKTFPETCGNDRILRSQVSKEEQKKDLTAVVNMLQRKHLENLHSNREQLCLESMHSNSSAVYQTVESSDVDLMKTQMTELKDMISGQTAVLGPDGQFLSSNQELNSDNMSQTYRNEESNSVRDNEVICSICYAKFSTKKTLAVHTRTLHTSHRLCYPCPCCSSTFANTWSVYRHLFKVHRKSNDQVRKLRSQIQEKAFIKDTTAAEDLQKEQANKTSESNTLRVNETQEWMDHLESDTELQRCGGCGKRFDRKAALSAHSQYCHRRVAAYEGTTKIKKANKISPDRVSNDSPVTDLEIQKNHSDTQNSSVPVEINNTNEISIRVEAVASLSKADWDMLGNGVSVLQNGTNEYDTTLVVNEVQDDISKQNPSPASDTSDTLEIVYTSINKHKTHVGSKKRKNKESTKKLTINPGNNTRNVPMNVGSEQETEIEKVDQALLMEKKIATLVNIQTLQCLPCNRKFTSVTNLRKHAAIHIGWNRYQCKLCDFKCFVKCDCVAHCNKMHNTQNNRVVIEDIITQIPDDQYTCDQNIMLDISNLNDETPEIVEVNISPECIEPEVQLEEEVQAETEVEVETTNPTMLQETVQLNGEAEEILNNDIKNQNTLGLDPDLRKMVMEVIFGSSETNSLKQLETQETIYPKDSNSKLQHQEDVDVQTKGSNLKEIDMQDNPKPQRPIRNKMKRLNKDFIYDLKDVVYRKDSLIVKPFNKLAKKSPMQEEDNLEKDTEQPSKRFKQNDEVSILCENSVIEKCDIKLQREGLKNSLTFSQCHS